jgi:hypothetical protein
MDVEQLHRNAEHCLKPAHETADELQCIRYLRAARTWQALARKKSQLDAGLFDDPEAQAHPALRSLRK